MKRLNISDRDIMEIALQNEINRSEGARYDHRLHGILLACRGFSCYEIGEMFGHDPTTIQRWVNRFEESGFSGLQDAEKAGRPKRLTQEQLNALSQDLRKSPRNWGYHQNLWDGKLLSHHIFQIYSVSIKVRQCQRLFHQMGFRVRKPRPIIAHFNPEEQEAFKKTAQTGKKK